MVFKMIKAFLAVVAFLAWNSAFAQIKPGEIKSEQIAQDWSSFILSNTSARMTTSSKTRTGTPVTLALQMSPPCDGIFMRIIFRLPRARDDAGRLTWLLTMRVDNQRPLFGQISYNASIGDTFAIFTLDKLPQFPELLQGMIIGQGVQMRADELSGKEIDTVGFSLYGFTASYNRMKNLCQQLVPTTGRPNQGGSENLRQLPRPSLPPNPNAPQTPTLPRHPNSET
jgi:hypothetical protein